MSKNLIRLLTIFVILLNFNSALAQTSSAQDEKFKADALKLINSPEPVFKPFKFEQPSPEVIADLGFEQTYANVPVKFTMTDGKKLTASHFNSESKTTVILVHGVLSSSFTMNKSAGLIREAMGAEVFAVDLRGHGNSEGKWIDLNVSRLGNMINSSSHFSNTLICPAPNCYSNQMARDLVFSVLDLNSKGVKYSKLECGRSSL